MPSAEEKLGLGHQAYYQHDYGDRTPEWYTWLVANVIRTGKPGNILDLGCGPGLFVEMAAKWGLNVTGLDGSEAAVRTALTRNPRLKVGYCLLNGSLPFAEETVDNIVPNQVIEHLPAGVFANVLRESRRVLRRNGMMFIFSPSKGNKCEVAKDPTHVNPLYPSELRQCLRSAGFEVVGEPNSIRFNSRIPLASRLFQVLMRTSLKDWMSATTNGCARKL
jgi:SAM-dependent methyltransferase